MDRRPRTIDERRAKFRAAMVFEPAPRLLALYAAYACVTRRLLNAYAPSTYGDSFCAPAGAKGSSRNVQPLRYRRHTDRGRRRDLVAWRDRDQDGGATADPPRGGPTGRNTPA